jgi:hypothetical protein
MDKAMHVVQNCADSVNQKPGTRRQRTRAVLCAFARFNPEPGTEDCNRSDTDLRAAMSKKNSRRAGIKSKVSSQNQRKVFNVVASNILTMFKKGDNEQPDAETDS